MTKKRWIGIGAGGLVVAALAVGLAVRGKGGPTTRYETMDVKRGALTAKVTATGTLSALVTVQVGSQVSGRLQEIFVDFNSPVKKGQVVARIDPQLFIAAAEQARANYSAAVGNLTKSKVQAVDAKRQYDRQKALFDKQLIAQADLDTAQATADSADAAVVAAQGAVEQAQASLHQAEINLAYTTIVSPISGTVISRNVDVGQTVAAALQAPTLFTIAEDLTRMQVDSNVAEADVGKLEAGMQATFTVDAYPQTPFVGRIRQIRNAPITVQNVVTYDAVIDVDNPELKLRPGMTANVTVIYAQAADALRVPNAALRFRATAELRKAATRGGGTGEVGHSGMARAAEGAPGDRPAGAQGRGARARPADEGADPALAVEKEVWVLRGETPVPVRIVPGVTDGSATEVVRGDLREGDKVITDAGSADSKGSQMPRGPRMF